MSSDNLIRQRFVGKVLKEQSDEMLKYQEAGMRKRLHFHTNTLVNSRKMSVQEGENYLDGQLSYEHVAYERLLDMRRKVRRTNGGYTTRRSKIHNRFTMGAYYAIARELMFGLTEEVKSSIRDELIKEA